MKKRPEKKRSLWMRPMPTSPPIDVFDATQENLPRKSEISYGDGIVSMELVDAVGLAVTVSVLGSVSILIGSWILTDGYLSPWHLVTLTALGIVGMGLGVLLTVTLKYARHRRAIYIRQPSDIHLIPHRSSPDAGDAEEGSGGHRE